MQNFNDPAVLAAIISATATIIASLAASIAAGIIGKRFANIASLKTRLLIARKDILFLLQAEKEYCELIGNLDGVSPKTRIREKVRKTGLTWSGRNVPSRILQEIEQQNLIQ